MHVQEIDFEPRFNFAEFEFKISDIGEFVGKQKDMKFGSGKFP